MRTCFVAVVLVAQVAFSCLAARSLAGRLPAIALKDDLVIGLNLDDDEVVLGRIVDVAVDSRNNIYAVDASEETVHRFSSEGRYWGRIGGHGEGPGEFIAPGCIAIGLGDRVYVSGAGSNVEVLDANGIPIERIKRATTSPAQSIAVDDDANVYVVELSLVDQRMIHKYSGETHDLVTSFCDTYAVGHDVDTREEAAYARGAIAVQNDTILYVQSYPHRIRTFDLSGKLLQEIDARVAESESPRRKLGANGVQIQVPPSFSRTIVPVRADELLTIFAITSEGSAGKSYLDVYRKSDGARVASIINPPTVDICCRDAMGRLYSTEVRHETPVIVRYILR